MDKREFEIQEGLEIVNRAKELEKNGSYDQAAKEYRKARDIFKEIDQNKLSAQCLVAHVVNMIRYYLGTRDIEFSSENMSDFYIKKLEKIKSLGLIKLDEYNILISAYHELEWIFNKASMKEQANEMYYKRYAINHKYLLEKIRKESRITAKGSYILGYTFHLFLHLLHGHGRQPSRIFFALPTYLLSFSFLFWFFELIEYACKPEKPIYFIQAIYFTAITFTTVGYGDIIPKDNLGQIVAIFASIFGYFLLAGIATLLFKSISK